MSELAVMLVENAVEDKAIEIARKMLRCNTPTEIHPALNLPLSHT